MGKQVFCSSSAFVGTSVCTTESLRDDTKECKRKGMGFESLMNWRGQEAAVAAAMTARCVTYSISFIDAPRLEGKQQQQQRQRRLVRWKRFALSSSLDIWKKKESCVIREEEMTRMWYSFSPSSFFLHLSFLYTFCLARWAITFAAAEQLSHSAQCADEKLCSLKENFLSLSSVQLCRLLC